MPKYHYTCTRTLPHSKYNTAFRTRHSHVPAHENPKLHPVHSRNVADKRHSAFGNSPQHDCAHMHENGVFSQLPPTGLEEVGTGHSGLDTNEIAYKAVYVYMRAMLTW